MWSSEVPVDALLHVASFLRRDHHDFVAVEPGHSANDRRIIAEAAVAMDFAEIGEDALNVIERLRPLRMPRQFGLLPGGRRCVHLLSKGLNALLKRRDLPARGFIRAGRFHLGDLAFDVFQLLLYFFGSCHVA